jgi:hypothetical protein
MAVRLEFIDFIIPIAVIENKYPGGWKQCLDDHKSAIGGRVWYDDHLLRDGAMNPMDIELLVQRWRALGFEVFDQVDGQKIWKDCCVVESLFGGPTLQCDWLELTKDRRAAYLKGTEPGKVIGRDARHVS